MTDQAQEIADLRRLLEERTRHFELVSQQLQEQATELEAQSEEAQSVAEELEQSNEQLQSTLVEAEEAREAAAVAERFSRGILDSISDPFVVHDAEWRFRYVNDAAREIFEKSKHDDAHNPSGKILWDLYPELIGTETGREMRRAVDQRTAVSFEAYYARRGTWSVMYCYPLPDGGLTTQWKDITTRKQAEEAAHYLARATEVLSASLDYHKTLSELAQIVVPKLADWCAVEIVGPDGTSQQLAVAHADPDKVRFARELSERYPTDPNASTGVPNVLRTGKPEMYPEIPDELLVAGAVDEEHLRLSRELGLKSAMVVPLNAHGRTLGALTLVSAESGRRYNDADLSLAMELARRAALAVDNARLHQEALGARMEAENANRAKTEFLAIMSHELRTPLNAIAGYADLLRLGLRGPLSPEQDEYIERIQRSERHLLSLINDVLNFAKLEAGHVEYEVSDVPLHDVINAMDGLILPQVAQNKLTFRCSECPPNVAARGDAEKIRQVLLNLLSNAIKFTAKGGSISLECDATAHTVSLTVRDSGVGIPEDKLETVFEPFVQLGRELAERQTGTGLGLAISRDLARGMGGDLRVTSRVGEGSAFTLTLARSS